MIITHSYFYFQNWEDTLIEILTRLGFSALYLIDPDISSNLSILHDTIKKGSLEGSGHLTDFQPGTQGQDKVT